MKRTFRILRRTAVVALVVLTAPGGRAAAIGLGSWHPAGSWPGTNLGPAVTLADGRVLVVHVETKYEGLREQDPHEIELSGERRTLATELFNPRSGQWVEGPSPPGEAASTLVALREGGALLLGETTCESDAHTAFYEICRPTTTALRLNPAGTAWAPVAPMLEARTRPATVLLDNGSVLVAGGFGASCVSTAANGYSCAPLRSAEIFDPATGVWRATPQMPAAGGGTAATLLSDGSVLLVGGEPDGRVLLYSATRGRWTSLAPALSDLTGSTLLPLPGDRAIALGSDVEAGFDGSYGGAGARAFQPCRATPEIYTLADDAWTVAPPFPFEPVYSCETDALALAGGEILDGGSVLDARQGCWRRTAESLLSASRMVALPDGEALALREEGLSIRGERYEPGRPRCGPTDRLRVAIFEHLAPQGTGASAIRLLAHPAKLTITLEAPGTITVRWRDVADPGNQVYVEEPLLVAEAKARSNGTAPAVLTMRLTPAGRRWLAATSRERYPPEVNLTATGTFTAGARTITVRRLFQVQTQR